MPGIHWTNSAVHGIVKLLKGGSTAVMTPSGERYEHGKSILPMSIRLRVRQISTIISRLRFSRRPAGLDCKQWFLGQLFWRGRAIIKNFLNLAFLRLNVHIALDVYAAWWWLRVCYSRSAVTSFPVSALPVLSLQTALHFYSHIVPLGGVNSDVDQTVDGADRVSDTYQASKNGPATDNRHIQNW